VKTLEAILAGHGDGLTPADVDRLLGEHAFPHIAGTTATFAYRGPAEEVRLRHWIFGLPSSQAFWRVYDTDLWLLSMELPERSRVEYKLEVVEGGRTRLIRDPLNPRLAHDPYGANSVCFGLGYETPEWTLPDEEARPGSLETIDVPSPVFGGTRTVRVYIPPRLRRVRRCPLLIAHDGNDYVRFAGLTTVLDNLIYRQEIPRIIVALDHSSDRLVEYADDERHATWLADELLPVLEDAYPLLPGPGARGLMGASFGGVASLAAAWRRPAIFGRLLLQSGSFAFSDIGHRNHRGPVFDPVVRFMNAFRAHPGKPAERIFVSCGTYESLIYENRSLVPLLQSRGIDVRYVEARDGHNWENWRDQLRAGLSWLFPGPLWMVYE